MNLHDKLEITCMTDPGRVHPHNEDSMVTNTALGLAVLADGMGGYNAGEIASAMAVETVNSVLDALLPELQVGCLDDETGYALESLAVNRAVEMANESVYQAAQQQPEYGGMGTTIVVLLFYDNRLTVAHIGDSRLYRIRDGQLEQITRDHTLMQDLIDRGYYTPDEARQSKNKNLVTRALGVEPTVTADIQEEIVTEGDIYLLCSDGLNDMVEDNDIHRALQECGGSLETAAKRLVALANENGGKDNISVILGRAVRPFPARRNWLERIIEWF